MRKEACRLRAAVQRVLADCRRKHFKYLRNIDIEDDEAVLDQMVSIWAGRFTGRMRQPTANMSADI